VISGVTHRSLNGVCAAAGATLIANAATAIATIPTP